MISETTAVKQTELRDKYLSEHERLVKEFGINPKVTGAHVLIKMIEPETKSEGGIVFLVDERDQEAMVLGVVINFGPTALVGYELPEGQVTRNSEDFGVSVGDFVEYDRHMGSLLSYKQFKGYRVLAAVDLSTVYKVVS